MKKIYITFSIFIFCCLTTFGQQLTVNTAVTPTQLVNTIVGAGVTVSNVTVNGAPSSSRGTFSCAGGCNIGLSSGIILTSGGANIAIGPNSSGFAGQDNTPLGGDPQLSAITVPYLTQDACVLEFDFAVASDSVRFNYIFGSDEYNEWVFSPYNDVFGFFISGPGIVGQKNIAIVPGTATTPVSINNVNNGSTGGYLPAWPFCTNCAYYRNNSPGPLTTQYDALTTVLTAGSIVQPCEIYHIKLAVADVQDHIYDSGVFLEANSFSSVGQIQIYANGIAQPNNSTVYVCDGNSVTLSINPASSYSWTNGATTQSIVVNQSNLDTLNNGWYACIVSNPVTGCFVFTTYVQVIFVIPTASIAGITSICAGGNTVLTANAGNSYLWSTGATTQAINVGAAGTYTVTVTQNGGCTATASATVVVGGAVANISGVPSLCNGAATILTANAGTGYQWSTGDITQAINVTTAGTYTVTVTQAGGCTASDSVTVVVNPNPVPNIIGNTSVCQGVLAALDAGAGYSNYQWSTSATTQTISTPTAGTYTVTVTDANGCTGTDNIVVNVNPLPVPIIAGNTAFCQGSNSILNAGAGYSIYIWSTTATTQTINVTTAGNYAVTVTNSFGCTGSTSVNIAVNINPVPVIAGTTAFCSGSGTILDAGAGYSNYQWSNSATSQTINVSNAGTFTVTITDANGCTGTASISTIVNPLPAPVIAGNNIICQGSNTVFNAGAGYSNYLWSTTATTQNINANTAGTYTVTVTDANGCTGTTSINLVVNPNPVPAITGNTAFCQGSNSILNAGAGYSTYIWSTTATTQTINVTTAGNYAVTVTNSFGCTGSTSVNIAVNINPVPVITGTTAFCSGSGTILDAGAGYSNYQWSNSATSQTINVSNAGTFTVTVTDANGCTGTASVSTIVNPLPAPVIAGNNIICQGSSTIFDAGGGYASYSWSTGALTQTINASASGSYTVTVTDINGCTAIDNISLTVNQNPAPVITGTFTFCQGNFSILDAGGGFNAYLWSTGATTRTINVTTGGPYTVTVTDINTCTGSDSKIITVNSLPTPTITGGTGICAGSSATLNAGNGYAIYQWSTGSNTQTINVSTAGNYTVTVTDVNGCTGSANTTMVVNPLPVPVIFGVTSVCQGTPTTFDAGAGYSLYAWSTGSGSQTINTTNAGTYTVTVTDINGCTGSDNISLVVNPLPVPAITGNTVFCSGNSSILNAGAGFNSYLWSTGVSTQTINVNTAGNYSVVVTNGFSCSSSASVNIVVNSLPSPVITGGTGICFGSSTILNAGNGYANYDWSTGATSQTITVTAAGNYSVTVTDNNGCSNITSTLMVINALPVPVITGVTAICQGTTTTFNAGIYSSYLWSTGATAQTISPGVAGNYVVTVTDGNGCTGSDNINLLVNSLPTPVITGINVICDGTSSVFNAGTGYTNYQWSTGANTQNISVNTAGNYTVTVTDGNGCVNSDSQMLTVNQTPVASFTNDTSLTCEAPIIHFNNTSSFPAGSVFAWDFGDGSVSTLANPSHIYSNPGTYPISLTITSQAGCVGTALQNVDIQFYPLPVAEFKPDPNSASVFNPLVHFTDMSQNAITWNWDFGDGKQSAEQNPKHYFDEIGKYHVTLIVTNIAGCVSKYEQEILITPFFVPNAFTPNGDGLNEVFFDAGYIMDVSSYNMTIWSRWGQKVYENDAYHKPWRGIDKSGKVVPEGSYVYQINVMTKTNKKYSYEGTVNLIR